MAVVFSFAPDMTGVFGNYTPFPILPGYILDPLLESWRATRWADGGGFVTPLVSAQEPSFAFVLNTTFEAGTVAIEDVSVEFDKVAGPWSDGEYFWFASEGTDIDGNPDGSTALYIQFPAVPEPVVLSSVSEVRILFGGTPPVTPKFWTKLVGCTEP